MTANCLSQIIGTAVIDDSFRRRLLSNPESALAQFDLEAKDRRAIATIQAATIEQFAEQLISWMNEREFAWA
jgi:23S rRNA maturation mini-RNase III